MYGIPKKLPEWFQMIDGCTAQKVAQKRNEIV